FAISKTKSKEGESLITDKIKNSDTYAACNRFFHEIFGKIKTLTPDDAGKRFVIEEGVAWISVSSSENAPPGDRKFEAHKKFLDIHFVLEGEEKFVYANTDELTPETEYNEAEDYLLLNGDGTKLTLRTGDFCIVYPQDAHIPTLEKLSEGKLVRGVAKIKI
ncbi:MAG: YhcH/YjgK/YiaL family protein, partial [Oscillospiraceae bacterium]|nr:YhcH/YjgK/YiaL family protein [Oscillospiraceae bacterium]